MQPCQRASWALMMVALIVLASDGAQGRLLRGEPVPAASLLASSGGLGPSRSLLKKDKNDGSASASGGDQSPRGLPVPRAVAMSSGRSGSRAYGYTSTYGATGGQNQPIQFSDSWANSANAGWGAAANVNAAAYAAPAAYASSYGSFRG